MPCSSGKRVYGDERLANRAISKAFERGEMPPLRAYKCPECGYWHLATNKRRASKLPRDQP